MVVTAKFTYLKMSSEEYFCLEETFGAGNSAGGADFLACILPIQYKNNYSNQVPFGDFNTSYFNIVSVVIATFYLCTLIIPKIYFFIQINSCSSQIHFLTLFHSLLSQIFNTLISNSIII